MELLDYLFRDSIIKASASTYNPTELLKRGLLITTNLTNQKIQSVGDSSNPVYPEIVVWKPKYLGATTGTAVVVEAIETASSLANPPINKWRVLASLGARFNLVFPRGYQAQVSNILIGNQIPTGNIRLQTYASNNQGGYTFTTL
jgi:hypothetical protein